MWSCDEVLERLAPDVEHGVGADQRVAQRAGLLGEEVLGLRAVLGRGEVEIERDAHQLVLADGVAGAAAAVGDVGLDRPEVPAAVEDHGQRLGEAERRDSQGDRGRGLGVDQRSLEEVVCVFVHVRASQRRVSVLVRYIITASRSEYATADWTGRRNGYRRPP